jgi:hypothetical protein
MTVPAILYSIHFRKVGVIADFFIVPVKDELEQGSQAQTCSAPE